MLQDVLIKILLAPFAVLYGIGVSLRNGFYRVGLLRSVRFDVPIISVGNLSVGGSGKTPHIEHLIRLLKPYIKVGVLSRGYKRQTRGYLEARVRMTAKDVGDEPLQFKRKFPDVLVAVGEERAFAIPQMMGRHPGLQCVLLDDAFQHRAVKPGLNILLTTYERPFYEDWLLPVGRLREWRDAYLRADLIVVSKCPVQIPEAERAEMLRRLMPLRRQQVFFSYYRYGQPYRLFAPQEVQPLAAGQQVLLFCAIANTDYLEAYLEETVAATTVFSFPDHHFFTAEDLSKLRQRYAAQPSAPVILTTEKDAMRLEAHRDYIEAEGLPIYVLPIEVAFHGEDQARFDAAVKDFLLGFEV